MEKNKVWEWSIDKFLAQSASSNPTPGGGSVSAYVGALGASMVCMVANLTIGKEKYKEVEPQVKWILTKAESCLSELKEGLIRDIEVFSQFMDVFKMPKDSEEQKTRRSQKMQEVLIEATESPMAVARKSYEVLELAKELAPIGNKSAISDVGVAAYLSESALKSAILSVDINLPQIKDINYKEKIVEERGNLLSSAETILRETINIVKMRL